MWKILLSTSLLLFLLSIPRQMPETDLPVAEMRKVETSIILPPELRRVCACESVGDPLAEPQHYNSDGGVLRGIINPQDIGQCQISEIYWLDVANKLGYNIYTQNGNAIMAIYIYENYGAKPWQWSLPCHGVQ